MVVEIPTALPIAVVSALFLFLLKEAIEIYRRWSANKLKKGAIRELLVAECERNNFSVERMRRAVASMDSALQQGFAITIANPFSSREKIRILHDDGSHSGMPIPKIHVSALEKYLFDMATLDGKLFGMMRDAQDALAELQHVRDGLVIYPTEEEEHIDGFLIWAQVKIEDHIEPIRALYFHLTCEPLAKERIR